MRAIIISAASALLALGASAEAAKSAANLSAAKGAVKELLKDPASAQFRKLRQANDPDRSRVCGEVNSKNGYGGFVGFQKFVYFPDTKEGEILDEDWPSVEFIKEKSKLFGSCFR